MRSYRFVLAAAGLFAAMWVTAVGGADQKPPVSARPQLAVPPGFDLAAPKVREWLVYVAIDASRRGTYLYRDGRYQECYQYYAATLLTASPFIADPELKSRVLAALYNASPEPYDKACGTLRTALNDIRNRNDFQKDEQGNVKKDAKGNPLEQPLFARLGGREAVQAIVKATYDKASDKGSGVNLDRNGEYPYTKDRAQRMQKATADMIQKLSDRAKPNLDAKPIPAAEDPKQLEAAKARKALSDEFQAAAKKLAELPATAKDEERNAGLNAVYDANRKLAALSAEAAKPVLDAKAPEPVSKEITEYLTKAHRTMRITDEEFTAAVQILRDVLGQYSVPEKETEELVDVVEALRASIVNQQP